MSLLSAFWEAFRSDPPAPSTIQLRPLSNLSTNREMLQTIREMQADHDALYNALLERGVSRSQISQIVETYKRGKVRAL